MNRTKVSQNPLPPAAPPVLPPAAPPAAPRQLYKPSNYVPLAIYVEPERYSQPRMWNINDAADMDSAVNLVKERSPPKSTPPTSGEEDNAEDPDDPDGLQALLRAKKTTSGNARRGGGTNQMTKTRGKGRR